MSFFSYEKVVQSWSIRKKKKKSSSAKSMQFCFWTARGPKVISCTFNCTDTIGWEQDVWMNWAGEMSEWTLQYEHVYWTELKLTLNWLELNNTIDFCRYGLHCFFSCYLQLLFSFFIHVKLLWNDLTLYKCDLTCINDLIMTAWPELLCSAVRFWLVRLSSQLCTRWNDSKFTDASSSERPCATCPSPGRQTSKRTHW